MGRRDSLAFDEVGGYKLAFVSSNKEQIWEVWGEGHVWANLSFQNFVLLLRYPDSKKFLKDRSLRAQTPFQKWNAEILFLQVSDHHPDCGRLLCDTNRAHSSIGSKNSFYHYLNNNTVLKSLILVTPNPPCSFLLTRKVQLPAFFLNSSPKESSLQPIYFLFYPFWHVQEGKEI